MTLKCGSPYYQRGTVKLYKQTSILFINNKMKLNPDNCKALMITANDISWLEELPLSKFYYTLGDNIIDYSLHERDLGVNVNSKMNFEEHQRTLINKAYQLFGITKLNVTAILSLIDNASAVYI